jgi:hypothetical protein
MHGNGVLMDGHDNILYQGQFENGLKKGYGVYRT